MEEFDPFKVNTYTINQILDYIISGKCSKEDIYSCGFAANKRPELEKRLAEYNERILKDEEAWKRACGLDTVRAYKSYLLIYDKFGEGEYRGKHVADAEARMAELKVVEDELRTELFNAMQQKPWLFNAETICALIDGVNDPDVLSQLKKQHDVASKFISMGLTISFDDIVNRGIVPANWTIDDITGQDMAVPQRNIRDLGDFPSEKRTDIYFVGIPRGGKSSVLAGILSYLNNTGTAVYQPHYNHEGRDLVKPYYNGLVEATSRGKYPVSTAGDSMCFMKLNINARGKEKLVTFVEISGEAFRVAAESGYAGAQAWKAAENGAEKCLQCANRKLLVFIVDYATTRGVRSDWTDLKQAQVLDSTIDVLTSDGTGPYRSRGCTFSKVDTVAVIVTKSDLMGKGLSEDDKLNIAMNYLGSKFAAFMAKLVAKCRDFGINAPNNYVPYILTFSLGELKIGNTYVYDPADSATLVDFIYTVTRKS